MPRSWRLFIVMAILSLALLPVAADWTCEDAAVPFSYQPSEYYGPGEYFVACPETGTRIRCYHYHRHWICEKEDTYYWDRNLESAARTACGCPLPAGTAPSSPAVSKNPPGRFSDVPANIK